MALKVVDRAIQVHGAEGISQDQPLAYFYASLRTLKFADVSPWSSSSCSSSYCSAPHLVPLVQAYEFNDGQGGRQDPYTKRV